MAIVYNGTVNSLPDSQLPAAYAKPAVNKVADYEYSRGLDLSIPKGTVENADPAVTLANIIADAAVGINKQIQDILAAEFLGSANVTAHGELVSLGNNLQSMLKDSPALTNAAAAYTARVNLYVKAA